MLYMVLQVLLKVHIPCDASLVILHKVLTAISCACARLCLASGFSRILIFAFHVKIVEKCRGLGIGSGGFYRPGYRDGAKLRLYMICLGKNWDPESRLYEDNCPFLWCQST